MYIQSAPEPSCEDLDLAVKERSGGAAADVGSAAAAADEPGGGVQAKKRRKQAILGVCGKKIEK